MIGTRQTIAAMCFAMAVLPFATSSFAADDGPIVNDYSNMGADYSGSDDSEAKSDSGKSDASAKATAKSSSGKSDSSSGQASSGADGKPYKVNCDGDGACKVSDDVMVGYEKFGGHCSRCHGETAEGSTFAPSLVQRLKGMGQGRFTAAVAGGVTKLDSTTGMYQIMPAWANNEDVMNHVQQIWAFLKARSDGALPAGRPQGMDGGKG